MSDDTTIIREIESGGFGPKIDTGIPTSRRYSLSADAEGYEALFRTQQQAQNAPPTPSASPLAVLNGEPDRSPKEREELARQRYAESLTEHVTSDETPPEVVTPSPAPIDVFRTLTDDEKQRVEEVRNCENVQRLEAENQKAREANDSATGAQEQ